jgi:hypothetical protein
LIVIFIKLNKEGVKPKDLKDFELAEEKIVEIGYSNVVGQDSLNRFEKNFNRPKGQQRKKKKNNNSNNKSKPVNP